MSSTALLILARDRGERLAVSWLEYDAGAHGVDICVERANGNGWKRAYGITLKLGELWVVGDGLAKAIELAKAVRR